MLRYCQLLFLISLISVLPSCKMGPDFTKPPSPTVTHYTAEKDPTSTGNSKSSQHIISGQALSSTWWKSFQSPELNQIVQQGIHHNYTLASMQETLKQAEEMTKASQGALLPQMNMTASAGRQKYGSALFGPADFTIPTFSYYTFGPNMTWTLDIFGKQQRTIEQNQALMQYQRETLKATYLTLTGNIVTTSLSLAALNDEIVNQKRLIQIDKETVDLSEKAWRLGGATRIDLFNAQKQWHQDQIILPSLYQQKNNAQSELNILLGKLPSDWQAPDIQLQHILLPKHLPLSLPSELVRQRPDIAAAEALLHAACANVGIATANLYPQITLSAATLQEALSPDKLFNAASNASSMLAGITTPVFSGGTMQAERRAAIHAYKAAYHNYQQTIVQAFVQVSQVLHALQYDDQEMAAQTEALNATQETFHLTQISYQAGDANLSNISETERLYNKAQLAYIQALIQRYQDTAQLYLVLGAASIK